MTNTHATKLKIAVIPGDGIGPEVTAQGVRVLDAISAAHGLGIEYTNFDLGAARYHRDGATLPELELEQLQGADAILLGAVGDPTVPSGILERELLLKLRFAMDHHVNLRPSHYYPGTQTPLRDSADVDFVVVREGTEGLYCGNGGAVRVGTPHEIATEVSVNTAYGVERVVRFAFALAKKRERKHLTLVHKHNVLVHAGHLWRRTVDMVAEQYPDVTVDYMHIDAATIYLVTDPRRFDVIVTDNLFGDILTDLAAAITGGIGLAASGNLNPSGQFPSMFEPVHGSAPDIAGQEKADPTAAILSVALLLDHVGFPQAAQQVRGAVDAFMQERAVNPGCSYRTSEIADRIIECL